MVRKHIQPLKSVSEPICLHGSLSLWHREVKGTWDQHHHLFSSLAVSLSHRLCGLPNTVYATRLRCRWFQISPVPWGSPLCHKLCVTDFINVTCFLFVWTLNCGESKRASVGVRFTHRTSVCVYASNGVRSIPHKGLYIRGYVGLRRGSLLSTMKKKWERRENSGIRTNNSLHIIHSTVHDFTLDSSDLQPIQKR